MRQMSHLFIYLLLFLTILYKLHVTNLKPLETMHEIIFMNKQKQHFIIYI